MNRRTLCATLVTVGTVAIAGCSGGSKQSETGPEEVVKQYWTASRNGDTEGVNAVLHPEAPSYPAEGLTESDEEITLNEVTEVSAREVAEQSPSVEENFEEDLQQQINTIEQQMEAIESETGAEDTAIVLISRDQQGEKREIAIQVVKDDDWYVYV